MRSPPLPPRSAQTTLGCPRGPLGISARLLTCLLWYLLSIICRSFLRQCSLQQPHRVNFCSRKPRHATIQEIPREKKRKKFTWSTWTRKFTWSDIQQNKVILPPAAPCKLFFPPFWDDAETKVYMAKTDEKTLAEPKVYMVPNPSDMH